MIGAEYGSRALTKVKSFGESFTSKKRHFNFITAHYLTIVVATIIASILLFAGGQGNVAYTDALLFASGANTQAGLNPVDVNLLNTFQQIVMYIFPMISNPITLHGSVVLLRLYWFEKRFQGLVRDVRQRRIPLTKSKSKARDDIRRVEEGVNGRDITRVNTGGGGTSHRVTNDGVLLSPENKAPPNGKAVSSSESDTTVSDEKSDAVTVGHLGGENAGHDTRDMAQSPAQPQVEASSPAQTQPRPFGSITFAETVKRSDGIEDEMMARPQNRSKAEHIAILERQRNQDNEVLRIPGPRETERGLGPQRLDTGDYDDDNQLYNAVTRDSRPEQPPDARYMRRNPTITIAEPQHKRRNEAGEDRETPRGSAFRLRTPRTTNRDQSTNTEDEDDDDARMSRPTRTRTLDTLRTALSRDKYDDMPYLSYTPTMGRNSNFLGLTLEQREELGGIEYRSLRTLAFVLLGYFWGFQLLALICLLPFIQHNDFYGEILAINGVGRTWWAFWTANVAFMDVGFTLTPDSMISFQRSEFVLMIMWFFIIIGNTAFPVMLRFIIWVMSKVVPRGTGLWEELRFLLDHPRRCFTLLFPSAANWWLFWILIALNVVDVVFFIILDHLPVHTRIVNGLFQAASTRTAGFSSVSLSELHPAMPVLYMIMMYISVFPIAISIRRTNVYEEKSLGVYREKKDDDYDDDGDAQANPMSYVGTHLRRQLSFDLWFVFLGFFLLAICEGSKIKQAKFDMFGILFEIVSAYGTVGMSMGATGVNASLCSQFSIPGKLIIVAMEIRGRHRGLPYGLDRAVILPSESRLRETQDPDPPVVGRTITKASTVASQGGLQRRGSTISRRGSFGPEKDRRLLTKFLHPGPVVPPGLVHSPVRRKSMDSQALSQVMTNGSREPQSVFSTEDEPESSRSGPETADSRP